MIDFILKKKKNIELSPQPDIVFCSNVMNKN